jgi:hypothetical protein
MAGTSSETSVGARRASKPKLSRAAVTKNVTKLVKQGAERAVRPRRGERPARGSKEALAVPDDAAPMLLSGALSNAVIVETIPVAASIVWLKAGLYAVKILTGSEAMSEPGHLSSPVRVGTFAPRGELEALSAAGSGEQWLLGIETKLAVRAARDGGLLIATAFGSADRAPSSPSVIVQSLDGALPQIEPREVAPPEKRPQILEPTSLAEREIRAEITAHIERVGDRTFAGSTWVGVPGAQRRIEGFSIRPLQEIQPSEIEYKALHPGGIETPWVRGPQFCGTRGRNLPLTGLAIRIAPHVQDQFSVIYQAAFFRSGLTEPCRNGAPCLPKLPGDSLESVNIRIVQGRPAWRGPSVNS